LGRNYPRESVRRKGDASNNQNREIWGWGSENNLSLYGFRKEHGTRGGGKENENPHS